MKYFLRVVVVVSLAHIPTTARAADENATLRISPVTFKIKVFVNGKELGEITDGEPGKEFKYTPRWGPNVLTLESQKFKSNYTVAFTSQNGTIHSLTNIHFEPKKITKVILATLTCNEGGSAVAGDEAASRSKFKEKYTRTAEYWKEIVNANKDAQSKLDKLDEPLTFERVARELRVSEDLGDTFDKVGELDVDPELVMVFKQANKLHKAILPARKGVENGWNIVGVTAGIKAAVGDLESLKLSDLLSGVTSAGDAYTVVEIARTAKIQQLHAIIEVMEYRYGGSFTKITPAYNSKNAVVGISKNMVKLLFEE